MEEAGGDGVLPGTQHSLPWTDRNRGRLLMDKEFLLRERESDGNLETGDRGVCHDDADNSWLALSFFSRKRFRTESDVFRLLGDTNTSEELSIGKLSSSVDPMLAMEVSLYLTNELRRWALPLGRSVAIEEG